MVIESIYKLNDGEAQTNFGDSAAQQPNLLVKFQTSGRPTQKEKKM